MYRLNSNYHRPANMRVGEQFARLMKNHPEEMEDLVEYLGYYQALMTNNPNYQRVAHTRDTAIELLTLIQTLNTEQDDQEDTEQRVFGVDGSDITHLNKG